MNIDEDSEEELVTGGYSKILFEKIRQNHENWIGKQYVEVHKESSDYPLVSLSDLANIVIGDSAPQDTKYFENGIYPFFRVSDLAKHHITDYLTESKTKINELATKKLKLFKKGTILFPKSGATSLLNHRGMLGCDGYVVNHIACIIANQGFIIPKYLFHILSSVDAKNSMFNEGYPSIRKENIEKIKIPLPPLSVQHEIVNEIESYRKIIEGAKQVVQNWKPKIEVDEKWQMVKLSECCQINPKKKKLDNNLDVSFIDMATLPVDGYKFTHSEVKKLFDVEKGYTYFEESDIVLAKITPCFENGKCGIATNLKNSIGFGSTEFIVLRANKEVLPEYLYLFIASKEIKDIGKKFMTGTVGQQRISLDFLKDYKIPLPSIVNQEKIISKLEIERDLIKNQNKILEIYEQKISDKINSIWKK